LKACQDPARVAEVRERVGWRPAWPSRVLHAWGLDVMLPQHLESSWEGWTDAPKEEERSSCEGLKVPNLEQKDEAEYMLTFFKLMRNFHKKRRMLCSDNQIRESGLGRGKTDFCCFLLHAVLSTHLSNDNIYVLNEATGHFWK
jgi:hypothetical protein